jgi:hypothetical protein
LQTALVVPGPRVHPIRNPLVPLGLAQPVGLGIQQPVQGLLDRLAHQFIQMPLDLLLVHFDCVLYLHTVFR